jgi:transposase
MTKLICVRELTGNEREQLKAGLRSSDTFLLRRCQILLASADGEHAIAIACMLGCDDETVRYVIKGFNARGLAVLQKGSRRPHTIAKAFPDEKAGQLKELLHHSPRQYGKATSLWTLKVAAEVSLAEGLTAELVSDETIRATLKRLGIGWKRAKQWITSPDPEYQRKKSVATG